MMAEEQLVVLASKAWLLQRLQQLCRRLVAVFKVVTHHLVEQTHQPGVNQGLALPDNPAQPASSVIVWDSVRLAL